MKLNKDTRDKVGVGTILYSDSFECKVVNITNTQNGKRIALDVLKSDIPWMVGRKIYGGLSNYYGMEIKETTYFDVVGYDKVNGGTVLIEPHVTEAQAMVICESWGWFYDDGRKTYPMGIEEERR